MTDTVTPITAPPTFETLHALWMGAVPTAGPSEKHDREMNFRAWAADHDIIAVGYETELDEMAANIYNLKAQSPREMTPERWAMIKRRFPGSARQCLEAAREEMENN